MSSVMVVLTWHRLLQATMTSLWRCVPVLFLTVAAGWIASAQSTKAELFGVVRDPGGLPVNGATVELVNAGTDVRSSVRTDAGGAYSFFALPAGTYRLEITKEGFSALRRDGLIFRVGDRLSLDFDLQVGN